MVNIVNVTKSACKTLFKNPVGKTAGKYKMGETPRLFSIRSNPVLGTEIRNNMTGTSYLRGPGVVNRNYEVAPLVTIHRADGTYSGMQTEVFDNLLAQLKRNPENWNPIIKSDPFIGKELSVNNPKIAGRYFRSAESIDGQLITKIANGRHHGMRLEEFDKMILDLLG